MEAVKKELARSRAEGRAAVSALEEEVVRVQMRHEGVQRELVAAKADAEARESELGARTSELASLRASRAAEMAAADAALTELREALAAKEEEVCVCACMHAFVRVRVCARVRVCVCVCVCVVHACVCVCVHELGPFLHAALTSYTHPARDTIASPRYPHILTMPVCVYMRVLLAF